VVRFESIELIVHTSFYLDYMMSAVAMGI